MAKTTQSTSQSDQIASKIEIASPITVGQLAEKLSLPVSKLITELMKNGVMATVNERIDFDTAQIIVDELGLDIELIQADHDNGSKVRSKNQLSDQATNRPPVIAVMGHVDHGKTSLIDAIRQASVAKSEAGGITQHISAYQITHDKRSITLLDTPGHEAFAALREHGAQLTDLVLIVVAADDGLKPQTLEAIRFARKAGVKMVVAINKIDKEGADINRIKQQLAEQQLMVEEWGGDTVVVEVSAKTGQGIKELLDMLLLVADVEELKADFDVPARGLIIEAHMEQGRGPVAVALVEAGQLASGQFIVAGQTYARIRNLENTDKQSIKLAGPSTPVIITGFKSLPEFGDEFKAVKDEKIARQQAANNAQLSQSGHGKLDIKSSELIRLINRSNALSELNIIIKADVQGSLTSVIDSLKGLDTEEVAVRVVGSGVGAINENDIHLGQTSNAIIYGFNVDLPTNIKQLASRDKLPIRLFKVIYELIDDVKSELSALLAPEIVNTELGQLEVKGVFKVSKSQIICGGLVTMGRLSRPASVRIVRAEQTLGEAELVSLKRGQLEAKDIIEGEMCGLALETKAKFDLQIGDKLEFYSQQLVERQLK